MTARELVIVANDNRRSWVKTSRKHERIDTTITEMQNQFFFPHTQLEKLYKLVTNLRVILAARFYEGNLKIIFFLFPIQKLISDFSQKHRCAERACKLWPFCKTRTVSHWRGSGKTLLIASLVTSNPSLRLLHDYSLDILIKLSSTVDIYHEILCTITACEKWNKLNVIL